MVPLRTLHYAGIAMQIMPVTMMIGNHVPVIILFLQMVLLGGIVKAKDALPIQPPRLNLEPWQIQSIKPFGFADFSIVSGSFTGSYGHLL